MRLVYLFLLLMLCLTDGLGLPKTAVADEPLDERQMAAEVARLDAICEKLELRAERRRMEQWLAYESDGQPLFLPVDIKTLPLPAHGQPSTAQRTSAAENWSKHFAAARERHGRFWLEEAKRMAAAGDEWTAYRHLWHAIREDGNNAEAKRTLGPLISGLTVRGKPRSSSTAHPQFGWPAGSFTRLDTTNFQLLSRADPSTTLQIADQLEQYFALWTQVFYPLWAAPGTTQARLSGRNNSWQPRREFRVIVCRDRDDYLATLGASEANIGVSVGYYNADMRLSFFYPSENLNVTLIHELTHQLLAEGSQLGRSRGRNDTPMTAGQARDFWIVEGIALYMESLTKRDFHWQVGGWLSPRMQSARYRGLHDGYWIDPDEFSAKGITQWKEDKEITQHYTHAAGLTHFFLDSHRDDFEVDQARAAFYTALAAAYHNDKASEKLIELMGGDDAQREYVHFLLVEDQHLSEPAGDDARTNRLPIHGLDQIEELVLTRSQLSRLAWRRIAQFTRLRWLDVSFTNATSDDLAWLSKMSELERVNLEGTAVDATTLELVARLPKLRELDLSQCKIDDAALGPLRGHRSLETLWLSGTQIGASSLPMLEGLPRLSFVAIDQTSIPADEAKRFSKRIASRGK